MDTAVLFLDEGKKHEYKQIGEDNKQKKKAGPYRWLT